MLETERTVCEISEIIFDQLTKIERANSVRPKVFGFLHNSMNNIFGSFHDSVGNIFRMIDSLTF